MKGNDGGVRGEREEGGMKGNDGGLEGRGIEEGG